MEAVSLIVPSNSDGRPSSSRSQPSATSSSSTTAGEVRQSIPLTFSAAASSSPRIPGPEPVIAK